MYLIPESSERFLGAYSLLLRDKASTSSPLRYPGGKTRAVHEIVKCFPPGLKKVCSPFLGGGSIELELANNGLQVFGYDIFEPLVSFWQVLLRNPARLAEKVAKFHPLSNTDFYLLQRGYGKIRGKEDRAAAFFVLNRASFSGTTLSGGMSPHHPRFTPSTIEHLRNFRAKNLSVEKMDFHESLAEHPDDFLYLDPPYANGEKLYGKKGSTHEDFDHEGLAQLLRHRKGWILSYNDCPEVRAWYKGFSIKQLFWSYGMNRSKKSNEVLIIG